MSRFKENSIYSDLSKSQQITTPFQATKKLLYFLSDSLGIDDLKGRFDNNKLEEKGYDLFSKQLPNFLAAFQYGTKKYTKFFFILVKQYKLTNL